MKNIYYNSLYRIFSQFNQFVKTKRILYIRAMKKSCFLLVSAIFFFCSCSDRAHNDFSPLDRELQNSLVYEKAYNASMDSLKTMLKEAPSDSVKWDISYKLQSKFYIHNVDSCYRYATLMLKYHEDDPYRSALSRACLSRSLYRLDSLERAISILESIDTSLIIGECIPMYYSTLYRLLREKSRTNPSLTEEKDRITDIWWKKDSLNVECVFVHNRYYRKNGDYSKAIESLQACFRPGMSPNDSAKAYYSIATEYLYDGQYDTAISYFVKSAETDCRLSVRAYDALYNLSLLLFKKGDIKRADRYMRITLQDAEESHYSLRYKDVVRAELEIMNTLLLQERQRKRALLLAVISIALLLVFATVSVIELMHYSSRLDKSRMRLDEASKIKDRFLALYMEKCVDYLNKVDEYRSSLRKAVKQEGTDAALAMLRKPSFAAEEFDGLLTSFDETFLGIFPDFVDKVNDMMQPQYRMQKPADGVLSTELRILALIRLGISKRPRIAKILNMSVTTVYSYHCNLQKHSIYPDASFDNVVAKL